MTEPAWQPSDPTRGRRGGLSPMLIICSLLLAAAALTHLIPAGTFARKDGLVVAGSYHLVPKVDGLPALFADHTPSARDAPARAAGVVAVLEAVPAGMARTDALIFMILFVGGMFGVLRATGAIDAGIDRLLQITGGNRFLLAGGLMTLLSCGSTFLGFSSEYVAVVPVVLELTRRLRLPDLFAPAIVATADFIGYNASVTNPIALGVAQPLAGVPVFSGAGPRLATFVVMLVFAIAWLSLKLRALPRHAHIPSEAPLPGRHQIVLVTLLAGGAALIAGTTRYAWHAPELAAAFIALGIVLAVAAGMRPANAADAFLDGMGVMLLPCILIGVAGGIGIMLEASQVLDTIVDAVSETVGGRSPGVVAMGLVASEMLFGVLMPSVSAKAAVSLPILVPTAHLAGVGGQTVVSAVLLGSGLTNMVTPTNALLLAFLSAAGVGYLRWLRFVAPLFAACVVVAMASIYLAA